MYADIIIDISHEKVDKTFQYIVPTDLRDILSVGMLVKVPFGQGNSIREGYVVNITNEPSFDVNKLKYIIEIVTNKVLVESRMIALAAWIKQNYGSTMAMALKTVLPVKETVKNIEKKTIELEISKDEAKEYLENVLMKKNYVARIRLLKALIEDDILDYNIAVTKLSVSAQTIKALKDKNIISIKTEKSYRNPVKVKDTTDLRKNLNARQLFAVNSFCKDYDEKKYMTYLLHGVTGSGKTEVYLNMIEHVIKTGRSVIMLIPEISLTYQTVMRFYKRFGDEVSILNSRMSKGERYDQYMRAKNGDVKIMIGPRSALFSPFEDIGLIVIDEEHESAYKSEQAPKYHARETAIQIAKMHGASVVLGSATPSVTAYTKCMSGEYRLFSLPYRANEESELPTVHTVDLREELKAGNRSIFSRKLKELISDRLEKKQQIMLFINKRGYAGFVSCRSCGHVMKCPHCDVSLTAHNNGKLICHYCGYETLNVKKCPNCQSPYISGFRAGTQQIEELVNKMFPTARVLRMDMDTTKGKDGHEKILEKFANNEADILVGTQMIVKGHDFSNVTLVGILAADMSLYAGNYMAAEKTYELLVQAAGRAGREHLKGEVVIQTYTPEHFSIVAAAKQDYKEFYEAEIQYRTLLNYPPVSNMLLIKFSSAYENQLEKAVKVLPQKPQNTQLIGPVDAPIYKINDIYSKVIYLKSKDYRKLTEYAMQLDEMTRKEPAYKNVNVLFDYNPMNM